jgi:hypothetical protein
VAPLLAPRRLVAVVRTQFLAGVTSHGGLIWKQGGLKQKRRIKQAKPSVAEAQGEELVPESGARKYGQTAATLPVRAWTPGAPGEGCFSIGDPLAALVKAILGQ